MALRVASKWALALPLVFGLAMCAHAQAQRDQTPAAAPAGKRMTRDDFAGYLRALQAQDFDALVRYYTPDVVLHVPGAPPLGIDVIVALERGLAEEWDWTMDVLKVVMDDDGIAIHAANHGPFLKDSTQLTDAAGNTPKAGERWSERFVMLYTLRDGKISELTFASIETRREP